MITFLTIILIIAIILVIAYLLIGNYFYNIALNPKKDKEFVLNGLEVREEQKKNEEEQFEWLKNNSKDVYINSSNNGNLKLHSYEINIDSNVWVIAIHGYMGEAKGITGLAREFNKRNYNILLTDLRGHGLSEGSYVGMGWHDRLDVLDWINYLIKKDEKCKIILYGISMGGATVMMTLGEALPSNVKLAIEDCGYTSAWDEFSYKLKQLYHLPEFPVLYSANTITKKKAGYDFKKASAIKQLKKAKTPILFIHGSEDDFVPFYMLNKVYEAATSEKEKLVIEGANHGMSSIINPELYWKTIDSFISKYI